MLTMSVNTPGCLSAENSGFNFAYKLSRDRMKKSAKDEFQLLLAEISLVAKKKIKCKKKKENISRVVRNERVREMIIYLSPPPNVLNPPKTYVD